MTESDWIKQLSEDGYSNFLFCENTYSQNEEEHAHDRDHKIVVFLGDMKILIGYETFHLGEHDYLEISRGTNHCSRFGSESCRYLLAERL